MTPRYRLRSVALIVLLVCLPTPALLSQKSIPPTAPSAPDVKAAIALCNTGNAKACNVAGAMYAIGIWGVKEDTTQAFNFFLKACNGGYAIGCENLANQYFSGIGVTMDRSRAGQLYQRSCDLGAAPGCVDLGVLYRDGKGVAAKNPTYAAKIFQKACDLSAAACASIASMYELGVGVPKDIVRAKSLYQRSCYAAPSDSAEDIQKVWSRASCNVLTRMK
jgi:TPR repeat protein